MWAGKKDKNAFGYSAFQLSEGVRGREQDKGTTKKKSMLTTTQRAMHHFKVQVKTEIQLKVLVALQSQNTNN